MITQITKLKYFGIFSDFKCTEATVRPFKRFNLVYGWNGSGKSTLTKLFACLEKRKIIEDFNEADFSIMIADQLPLTQHNISDNNLNIRVFNEDFVTDNIQWNIEKSAKSILILSEEKIEEKKKLDFLKNQIIIQETLEKGEQLNLANKMASRDNFLSSTAKTIKEAFKIIDTSDKHYFNYNKAKLENFIASNTEDLQSTDAILNPEAFVDLTTSIKPISKSELDFELKDPLSDKILEAEEKIKNILKTSIVTDSIKRLEENSEIQTWVERGLEIHRNHRSENCEYCMQVIPAERKTELESHFNDEYKKFILRIDVALEWSKTVSWSLVELPDASAVYDEFQKDFLIIKGNLIEQYAKTGELLAEWTKLLEEKKANPFKPIKWALEEINDSLSLIVELTEKVNAIKSEHNGKTKNFDDVLTSQKSRLETHYCSEAVREEKYFVLLEEIEALETAIAKIKDTIKDKTKAAYDIEKELTDEVKGAAQFNDMLHSFLGRDDISLQFIPAERGYKILRKGSVSRAKNLSEGEKTAIAFIYFIIKLRENGNDIKNTIVVVDDPVSSLDSNHLIHAYSFLKGKCSEVKQLFVLTHNFNFFKLIRDWIFYINPAEGDKNFYVIDPKINNDKRQSVIVNANNFLIKYNSEYHYLFFKINEYATRDDLQMEDMYVIANLSRRFIESLITFKYPKKEKDIWSKFKKIEFDEVKKAKVYKFINLHSHNDKIESHEGFGDNLFAEGKPLVTTVMEFIRAIDEHHYDELISISNN